MWSGTQWVLVGDGTGISSQNASSIYLSKETASSTYLPLTGGQLSGDLIVDGDLTVSGSTTYLNVNELNIEDNLITLNYGVSGSPSLPAGIEVERGDLPNTAIRWNEELDVWEFTNDGSEYNELGSGAGVVLYQSSSPDGTALGLEVGAVWIDSDADLSESLGESHIHGQYLSIDTASSTYLTMVNASSTYANKTELEEFLNTTYSSASPVGASAGYIWFDNTDINSITLKVYNGTEWIEVSGTGSSLKANHFMMMGG